MYSALYKVQSRIILQYVAVCALIVGKCLMPGFADVEFSRVRSDSIVPVVCKIRNSLVCVGLNDRFAAHLFG